MKLNLKIFAAGICLMCLFQSPLFSENSDIIIEQADDREKAVIPNPSEPPVITPKKGLKEIKKIEDTTLGVAQKSSHVIGKGTDKAVGTVQKVGDSMFSRWFKAMDFSKKKADSSAVSGTEKG